MICSIYECLMSNAPKLIFLLKVPYTYMPHLSQNLSWSESQLHTTS